MPIRPLTYYGDPVLARPAPPVERFDDELKRLVADMVATMYAAPGVGLAAPQIGVSQRVAVIDTTVGEDPGALLVLVNPEIVALEGEQVEEEGCLSVPGFTEVARRAAVCEVRAFDADGNPWSRRADGLLARAFQHELDHLDGKLYIERLSRLKRTFLLRKLSKQVARGEFPPRD